jgi:hypothetical protein
MMVLVSGAAGSPGGHPTRHLVPDDHRSASGVGSRRTKWIGVVAPDGHGSCWVVGWGVENASEGIPKRADKDYRKNPAVQRS